MTSFFQVIIALCMAVTISLGATTNGKITGGSEHETPDWFKQSFLDINEDVEEATQNEKHLILFVDLDGCPYCTKMLKESFISHNETSNFAKQYFDVINLNVKGSREVIWDSKTTLTEKDLAVMLKIQYSPTILFLDSNRNIILRINGYRTAKNFKQILEYIQGKHYKEKTLTQYLASISFLSDQKGKEKVSKNLRDLSTIKTPLALLFEEKSCSQCDYLNNVTLKNEELKKEIAKFTLIRFDANSEEEFISVDGIKTTPKKFVTTLNLDYRPGILLYNEKN